MKHIKTLRIDIDKKNFEVIPSVQYDSNTRFLHIYLLNNSIAFDITGCSVKISGTKPDGTMIFNNCTIINAKEGFIEVELTEQMNAVPGTVKCELKLYAGNGVLTTKQFEIEVSTSVTSKEITSSNEFKALTEALSEVNSIDVKFQELTQDAVKEATEKEIQKQISLGNMANLAIANGSITQEKLDPNIKFGIEDGEVTIEKLEFMKYKYINLFNPNDPDFGQGQIISNGSYNSATLFYHSGYIAVIPGETIYYSAGYKNDLASNNFIQGYNKDKQIVKDVIPASTKTTQVQNDPYSRYFTVPDGIYFIRFGSLAYGLTNYKDFIVSREYHSYTEKIHHGTYENIDFSIDKKWKPYIFEALLQNSKIKEDNLPNDTKNKINTSYNSVSYLPPNTVKSRIVEDMEHDSIRSDVKLLGNIFPQENKYIAWLTNNSFYDKDIDKVVCFYNARESHYGGTGTVNYRLLDKNDAKNVSNYKIACKPEDVAGQTKLTNGMVTCSCAILNDGSWLVLAKNHSAVSNGIDKVKTIEVYKSTNKGETWSNWSMKDKESENIVPNIGGSYALLQTKTGRIITINYYINQVRVYYSDDNGLTWDYSLINNNSSYANDKLYFGAGIVDIDGTLMLIQRVNIREANISAVLSYSNDNGTTWSDFVDSRTITNVGGTPVCAIAHDGVVEVLYGERVAREGESGGRIYHTAATYKDALEDNFLPPKIIGYSNNSGDNFGYFGGCADDKGNIHVFYYDDNLQDSAGHGCNLKYIKGSFYSKLNLKGKSKIKNGESKVIESGVSNYRIYPTSAKNNENCTGAFKVVSGNLLDVTKDFNEYFDYEKFTNPKPANTRKNDANYSNIFEFKQGYTYNTDLYGQKVKVEPYTDYIVSVPVCGQPYGFDIHVVVYGNNSFIDSKTLSKSKYAHDMCVTFNSKANDEVLVTYHVGSYNTVQYQTQIINPAMNIYKKHSMMETERFEQTIKHTDYKLRYINEYIKDKIENGVFVKNVVDMLINENGLGYDSFSVKTTNDGIAYVSWINRINKYPYYQQFGGGVTDVVLISSIDNRVECVSYAEDKSDIVTKGKIGVNLSLIYNAPQITLPISLLENVTEDSDNTAIQNAIKSYFKKKPLTVYLPCPPTKTKIDGLPLVMQHDSIITNMGENTVVEIM